jgi:hypothetical protein
MYATLRQLEFIENANAIGVFNDSPEVCVFPLPTIDHLHLHNLHLDMWLIGYSCARMHGCRSVARASTSCTHSP